MTKILTPTDDNIALCAAELKSGGLVAFATETVYGLGANALDSAAVKKIFEAKGRPSDNPLIVHLSSKENIATVAYPDARALTAAERFMPGALTMVLNKKETVPDTVTGGLKTVAVRIPASQIALRLIAAAGVPVAAPSANTSTRPSPTEASHVATDLSGKIKYVLDGGPCQIGIESTIVDFTGERLRVLRRGGVPVEALEAVLGPMEVVTASDKALSPGMKYRHYSPSAEVVLFDYGDTAGIEKLESGLKNEGKKTIVLALSKVGSEAVRFKDADEYAQRLFFEFRRADGNETDTIICELAPDSGIGASVNNRLVKAAGGEHGKKQ